MPRTLRVLVSVGLVLALTACEPTIARRYWAGRDIAQMPRTGDARCDAHDDILDEIESHGWTIDCTPDFPNRGTLDGGETWFPIWGWADQGRQTVWIWPDAVDEGGMRYLLWHELAHVTGIADEDDADAYAWCRERLGFDRGPSEKSCEELGA